MLFNFEAEGALSNAILFLSLVSLCAAYIQGGLTKLADFSGAVAEMRHFGLAPPYVFAVLVITIELAASTMVITGFGRWIGALALAAFTLSSTLIALRFWEHPKGPVKSAATNAFFEHIGLAGGLLLVAWLDVIGTPAMAQ